MPGGEAEPGERAEQQQGGRGQRHRGDLAAGNGGDLAMDHGVRMHRIEEGELHRLFGRTGGPAGRQARHGGIGHAEFLRIGQQRPEQRGGVDGDHVHPGFFQPVGLVRQRPVVGGAAAARAVLGRRIAGEGIERGLAEIGHGEERDIPDPESAQRQRAVPDRAGRLASDRDGMARGNAVEDQVVVADPHRNHRPGPEMAGGGAGEEADLVGEIGDLVLRPVADRPRAAEGEIAGGEALGGECAGDMLGPDRAVGEAALPVGRRGRPRAAGRGIEVAGIAEAVAERPEAGELGDGLGAGHRSREQEGGEGDGFRERTHRTISLGRTRGRSGAVRRDNIGSK